MLAVSQAKLGQLTWVAEWHSGEADGSRVEALAKAYKAKTGKDFLALRIGMTPRLLALVIAKAGSTDAAKVARAGRPELLLGRRAGAHARRRPPVAAAPGG